MRYHTPAEQPVPPFRPRQQPLPEGPAEAHPRPDYEESYPLYVAPSVPVRSKQPTFPLSPLEERTGDPCAV